MLERIIDFHLEHRWLVLAGLLLLIGYGIHTLYNIPVDAFPDLTNNQVVVTTEVPGAPPSEVEQQVTFPIETALLGLPNVEEVRSISKFSLSMVTVVFADSVETYFARQIVNERVREVQSRLPGGLQPSLGPIATAFGEVYQYTLSGPGRSPAELKDIQEWQIKAQLRAVPGVNEVNTWGGESRRYEIEVDPVSLQRYGLSLRDVFERVQANNENFGAGFIEHSAEQYNILGVGRARLVEDIERTVLLARSGTPVLLRDVARVQVGAMPRQGAVVQDGKGETVSGMAIMLKGENGKDVIERVKSRLASLRLPEGVEVRAFYDQSTVIDGTLATVRRNLLEGGALVVAVLFLFLGNARAAFVVATIIPLSMLVGLIGMRVFGVSANLMSLGAIDFGMIIDGAVVMMENAMRRLHDHSNPNLTPYERVRLGAHEVARPILFGVAIIIAVYLPIAFLEGLEGRMFRPMAITVCAALLGSLVLSLTVVPTAAAITFRHGVTERKSGWFDAVRRSYVAALERLFRIRLLAIALAVGIVAAAVGSLTAIGTEFMPRLDEGSILVETRKPPGISLSESVRISNRIEQILVRFPEVSGVVTKIGRPDLATEAMGIHQGDVYVQLHPRDRWKVASKDELIEAMSEALSAVPGVNVNFTQPMAMRLDEVVSGIKADVALKIFGEDSRVLEQLGQRALGVLSRVPGAADAQMETTSGVAELRIEADRAALARYGLNVGDVREVISAAIGGIAVSEMIEGQRRYPIVIRLPENFRREPDALRHLMLVAPSGERVPMAEVARIDLVRGPDIIARESAQRRIVVQANVRGRDLGSFVEEAQARVQSQLQVPAGYALQWGGQFENQERASRRLMIVLPAAVLLIFAMLFAMFGSVPQALLILLNVPFALVGGIAALWLRGLNLSLSASVGFIALFGVAVLNGIVLVSAINRIRESGQAVIPSVLEGAGTRLRPVLMTALVASLGFVPMAISTTTGAEIQRPLATVVIGGLITSTLLTLFLLPLLYPWFRSRVPEKDGTA